MVDLLAAIDWQWWMTDVPIRLDWWPGAQHYWYAYMCRLNIMLCMAGCITAAATFAAWSWSKAVGPIVLWDDGRE